MASAIFDKHGCTPRRCPDCRIPHGPGLLCFVRGNDEDRELVRQSRAADSVRQVELRARARLEAGGDAAAEAAAHDDAMQAYLGEDEPEEEPADGEATAAAHPGGGKKKTTSRGRPEEHEMNRVFVADIESEICSSTGEHIPVLLMLANRRTRGSEPTLTSYVTDESESCINKLVKDIIREDSPYTDATIVFHYGGKLVTHCGYHR